MADSDFSYPIYLSDSEYSFSTQDHPREEQKPKRALCKESEKLFELLNAPAIEVAEARHIALLKKQAEACPVADESVADESTDDESMTTQDSDDESLMTQDPEAFHKVFIMQVVNMILYNSNN